VPHKHRGRGFGTSLAKSYLYYAPRLGYQASVFNLVYVNNIASVKCVLFFFFFFGKQTIILIFDPQVMGQTRFHQSGSNTSSWQTANERWERRGVRRRVGDLQEFHKPRRRNSWIRRLKSLTVVQKMEML